MATGIRKLYYSIREVSDMTGLKPHVLRYWESEFDMLRPKKNRAGNRAYTDPDIDLVRRIQRLVHDDKYTLEGARQVLAQESDGEPSIKAATSELSRQELADLRAFLADVLRAL